MKGRSPIARLSFPELVASASRMGEGGNLAGAVNLYLGWLKLNPRSPSAYAVHFNMGCLFDAADRSAEALAAYAACLRANPQFSKARLNIGNSLKKLGRQDEAMAEWRKLLGDGTGAAASPSDPPTTIIALNNLGLLLEEAGRWGEAIAMLSRSLRLDPHQDSVVYHWVRLRQRICAWPIFEAAGGMAVEQMIARTSAVAMLSVTDDPALQLAAAQRNMEAFSAQALPSLSPELPYGHTRLRIGYLSSNFNLHAVSMLIAELLELHDRQRVEVFAFSWSPQDGSAMLQRIQAAVDHFVDITRLSDRQAALDIRAAEIDVLIDLQGLTTNARPRILAHRPAPVQVAWLGHPGTTAVPGVQYLIADHYLVPPQSAVFYAEKLLFMPACFQVNDRKRPRDVSATRAQFGLPESAFVFCAFNNTNKFTPEVFDCWLRIVQGVPHGVLWLLADNPEAEGNLLRYASAAGLDRSRLVFAHRAPYQEYLARFLVADLFLDTFPFNGGVTSSDALWMGLPLVTCAGRSFASRMSASLLHAVGLGELVTESHEAYEALAVALALDPGRMGKVRETLARNRDTCPLFDTPRATRNLEDLLTGLVPSIRAGGAAQ